MLIDADWFWLMQIDAYWYWLILTDIDCGLSPLEKLSRICVSKNQVRRSIHEMKQTIYNTINKKINDADWNVVLYADWSNWSWLVCWLISWTMLTDDDWCILMYWVICWLRLTDANWCWLVRSDAAWGWLMLIDADLCWLLTDANRCPLRLIELDW